jgi:hypothetical protein
MVKRQELQIQIHNKIQEMRDQLNAFKAKGGFTDPACISELKNNVLPSINKLQKKYRVSTLDLVKIPHRDLASIQQELQSLKEKFDYKGCIRVYSNARNRFGSFFFDYAAPLDKKYSQYVHAMKSIYEEAVAMEERQLRKSSGKFPTIPSGKGHGKLHEAVMAYKVMIVPKSGAKYEAVVKDHKVIEMLLQNEVLDLAKFDRKSSLNLYYMFGMSGSMGVRVNDLKSVTGIQPLGKTALDEMSGAIQSRVDKDREREKARIAKRKKELAELQRAREHAAARKKKEEEEKAKQEELKKRFALLHRFPPEKGWGEAKKKELKRRSVVIGVFPNEEEQYFLDHFDEWIQLRAEWKKLHPKK